MRKIQINIDEKLCKACYYCIEVCPKKVLGKSETLSPRGFQIAKVLTIGDCILCRVCERICPDFAISAHEIEENSEQTMK